MMINYFKKIIFKYSSFPKKNTYTLVYITFIYRNKLKNYFYKTPTKFNIFLMSI